MTRERRSTPFCENGHPFASLDDYRARTVDERHWDDEPDTKGKGDYLLAQCKDCHSSLSYPASGKGAYTSGGPHRQRGKLVEVRNEDLDTYMERHFATCEETPCRQCDMVARINQQRDMIQQLCPGGTEKARIISALGSVAGHLLVKALAPNFKAEDEEKKTKKKGDWTCLVCRNEFKPSPLGAGLICEGCR